MIGKGSFAKVYLANKKDDPTQYAIKAFNKEFMREQFKVNFWNLLKGERVITEWNVCYEKTRTSSHS